MVNLQSFQIDTTLVPGSISNFLDKSISMYYKWTKFFDQKSSKLDDINFILDKL